MNPGRSLKPRGVTRATQQASPTGEPLAALDTKARKAKKLNLLGDHLDGSAENLPPPPSL